VNRLPPEILSYITQYIPDENARDTRLIIPVTHVCRYWRESIISTADIWTSISSRSKDLAALSLDRSKAAPLNLWLDTLQIRSNPGFPDLIAPYMQNVETLFFCCASSIGELSQTLPKFPQSMPNLQSLSLSGPARASRWDWSSDPFGPLTADLTHFSLRNVPLYPSFLHFRALTDLVLYSDRFGLHVDTLLDFLEQNGSLESVTLDLRFAEPSLRISRRRAPIENRLRSLSIRSTDTMENDALISNITLWRGARLEITLAGLGTGLNGILPVISAIHLSNLQPSTFMEYRPDKWSIRLLGPNGSFSFNRFPGPEDPFAWFSLLPLTNIRGFYLARREERESFFFAIDPIVFPPSFLPVLETLAIEREPTVSHLLSALFSNPSSSPSLNTLAFLNCNLDEAFMEALTRFASKRKNTASAWLHRIVIVNSKGNLPRVALIDALGKHVPIVDARIGKNLPKDLI